MKTISSFLAMCLFVSGLWAQVNPITMGRSSNIYSIISTNTNQVYANDSLNTVAFIHRQDVSLWGGNSGQLRYDISTDRGRTFTNDVGLLNPLSTNVARYPQVSLFNPGSTTDPLNTKIAWLAPTIVSGAWQGTVSGTAQTTQSGPVSSSENYQFPFVSTNWIGGLTQGLPGEFWTVSVDILTDSLRLFKGVFDSTTQEINWQVHLSFLPNHFTQSINGNVIRFEPNMAFSPDGMTGWVAWLGDIVGGSDSTVNPILMKSTDGGASWGVPQEVDLRNYPWMADTLQSYWISGFDLQGNPVPASGGRPTTAFDFDLTVDVNGNPHLFTTIGSSTFQNSFQVTTPPNYEIYSQFAMFACDITTKDGGLSWEPMYVAPILALRLNVGTAPNVVEMDNFNQISRSEDGNTLFYSWLDSDTLVTSLGNFENNNADLYVSAFRISDSTRTCYRAVTKGDPNWEGNAMFPTVSPVALKVGAGYKVPTVMAWKNEIGNNPLIPTTFYYFGDEVLWTDENFVDPTTLDLSWIGNGNCSSCGSAFSVSTSTVDASCGLPNGMATVSVSPQTSSPYSYFWTTGDTDSTISDLAVSDYIITTTDAAGCQINKLLYIDGGDMLLTPTLTIPDCQGGNNGTISISAGGGTGPYTYQWSTGDTTAMISGLVAGNYAVTVTDAFGCVNDTLIALLEPPALSLLSTPADAACFGGLGSLSTDVQGGTAPYTYLWSNGDTTADLSAVSPGVYSLTVTDANQCTLLASDSIGQPEEILTSVLATDVQCFGQANGQAMGSANGGTAPFTFQWADDLGNIVGNQPAAANLDAGNYTLTVLDAQNCQTLDSVVIGQPDSLQWISSDTAVSCAGLSDGGSFIIPTGGTSPYTYQWSTGAISQGVSQLMAGIYTVVVSDSNGCTAENTLTITQPDSISSNSVVSDETLAGAQDGEASVAPTGGTPPYTFLWSNGETGSQISGLMPGEYAISITDANGCTLTDSLVIQMGPVGLNELGEAGILALDVFPNPSNGAFTLTMEMENPEQVEVSIFDTNGRLIYKKGLSPKSMISESILLEQSTAGVYLMWIRTQSGMISKGLIIAEK